MEHEAKAVAKFYATLPAENIADLTKENNLNNNYMDMLNAYGRVVPVPSNRIKECLAKGYVHTDGQLKSDNLADNVRKNTPRRKSEKAQLAEALTAVANAVKSPEVKSPATSTLTFEELKEKGWKNLTSDEKKVYQSLKPTE